MALVVQDSTHPPYPFVRQVHTDRAGNQDGKSRHKTSLAWRSPAKHSVVSLWLLLEGLSGNV